MAWPPAVPAAAAIDIAQIDQELDRRCPGWRDRLAFCQASRCPGRIEVDDEAIGTCPWEACEMGRWLT
jgi:hypothetical protein